eukprot:m.37904 g.37904  ORF g.37904 m.37904 type:complete len:239 (+) comp9369_c0_seq1:813-1529(+)
MYVNTLLCMSPVLVHSRQAFNAAINETTSNAPYETQTKETPYEYRPNADNYEKMCFELQEQVKNLECDNDQLKARNEELKADLARSEMAVEVAREQHEKIEADCDFKLNIMQQSKQGIEAELDTVHSQMNELQASYEKLQRISDERRNDSEDLKLEIQRQNEIIGGLNRKISNWSEEADRLRGQLDVHKRAAMDAAMGADEQIKSLRLEMHQLKGEIATLEVEKVCLWSYNLIIMSVT